MAFLRRVIITHNNEPKYVLPVRTAKDAALSQSLCRCSMGSKIRCSITPANTWYLQYIITSLISIPGLTNYQLLHSILH